jgi:hypothetical protein
MGFVSAVASVAVEGFGDGDDALEVATVDVGGDRQLAATVARVAAADDCGRGRGFGGGSVAVIEAVDAAGVGTGFSFVHRYLAGW